MTSSLLSIDVGNNVDTACAAETHQETAIPLAGSTCCTCLKPIINDPTAAYIRTCSYTSIRPADPDPDPGSNTASHTRLEGTPSEVHHTDCLLMQLTGSHHELLKQESDERRSILEASIKDQSESWRPRLPSTRELTFHPKYRGARNGTGSASASAWPTFGPLISGLRTRGCEGYATDLMSFGIVYATHREEFLGYVALGLEREMLEEYNSLRMDQAGHTDVQMGFVERLAKNAGDWSVGESGEGGERQEERAELWKSLKKYQLERGRLDVARLRIERWAARAIESRDSLLLDRGYTTTAIPPHEGVTDTWGPRHSEMLDIEMT